MGERRRPDPSRQAKPTIRSIMRELECKQPERKLIKARGAGGNTLRPGLTGRAPAPRSGGSSPDKPDQASGKVGQVVGGTHAVFVSARLVFRHSPDALYSPALAVSQVRRHALPGMGASCDYHHAFSIISLSLLAGSGSHDRRRTRRNRVQKPPMSFAQSFG